MLIELYSIKSDHEVTYEIRNEEIVEPRTINRLTYDLPIGGVKVEEADKDGLRVHVYKMINEANGSFSDEELVSRDFYPPKNKVVLVSSREAAEVILTEVGDSGEGDSSNPGNPDNSDNPGSVAGPSSSQATDSTGEGSESEKSNTYESNENNENNEVQDNDNSKSDGSYYDKGGNLITPDSK